MTISTSPYTAFNGKSKPKVASEMKLQIERNLTEDSAEREAIPWFITVEILTATADRGRIYRIPIHVRYVGMSKHFYVEICGIRLNSQSKPVELLKPTEKLLRTILNVSRFPTYMFMARRAGHLYPVYTINDEVIITTQGGGPVFRHIELAKVRLYLTDYLHDIKVLGKDGKSDKLHVRGVNPHTLGLRRPVFYFKKRVSGQEDFWAPVFETGDGAGIYTIAVNNRREVLKKDGNEVLELQALTAEALKQDRRLTDPHDLRSDRLMPEYWDRLEKNLHFDQTIRLGQRDLGLYYTEGEKLCLLTEKRPHENRFGLFFGKNRDDVVARAGRDFARRSVRYDE